MKLKLDDNNNLINPVVLNQQFSIYNDRAPNNYYKYPGIGSSSMSSAYGETTTKYFYYGLRYIPIKSRISILIALRIYQAIGHKIKRTGTKFLKENIYITVKEKIFLVIKSIIEFLIFFILPVYRKKHNKYLHEPLSGLADANTK